MSFKKSIILLIAFIGILTLSYSTYYYLSPKYNNDTQQEEFYDTESNNTEKNKTTTTNPSKTQAKNITIYDKDNNKVNLSDYIGKPIVLNFWASWCPPCKREMPSFQEMIDKYSDDITFLIVSITDGSRETVDTATQFINDNDYNINILFDIDGDASKTYALFYLPRTIFIDKEGYIIKDQRGEISKTELQRVIEKYMLQ